MTISEAIQYTIYDDIRLTVGDKWLVYDLADNRWLVYQRKKYGKKTIQLIRTPSEDEAVYKLLEDL